MHIVINGWFLGQDTAGSGQYLDHMLAYLPQLAPDNHYHLLIPTTGRGMIYHAPTSGDLSSCIELIPTSVPNLPRNLAKLWWEQVTVPRMARRLNADVLWVPYWAAPLWQPQPTVVTVHDLIPRLLPAYRVGRLQRLYTALVSLTARRATAILTVSHAAARDIVSHLSVPKERVHVVYHGPNREDEPPPTADSLQRVQSKYNLPDRFFLYLGSFEARKNVPAMLHAYKRYLDHDGDPSVKFVIAGKLPNQDSAFTPDPIKVAAALDLTNQIHFCGWIDEADKPALLALATVFLFPTRYEGFGMPVLEAMSRGSPVMTSSAYGVPRAESSV